MVQAVYDNSVVQSTNVPAKYLTTLAAVSVRDYRNTYGLPDRAVALDVDSIEKDKSGNNDKTMDVAIGIADYESNRISSARLLLVELRMNYGGQGRNSKTSDMKKKESHTRDLLSGNTIDKRVFFIFSKDVAPSKRSAINRESYVDKALKDWTILSPEEFVDQFMFVEDMPYQPESPIEDIRKDGADFVVVADFDNAIKLVRYWLGKLEGFYNQYKRQECKALAPVIDEVVKALEGKWSCMTDDSKLDVMIVRERIDKYIKILSVSR